MTCIVCQREDADVEVRFPVLTCEDVEVTGWVHIACVTGTESEDM